MSQGDGADTENRASWRLVIVAPQSSGEEEEEEACSHYSEPISHSDHRNCSKDIVGLFARHRTLCFFPHFWRRFCFVFVVLFACESGHTKKMCFNLPQTKCDEFCYAWRGGFVSICKIRVVSAHTNKDMCCVFGLQY